MFGTIYDKLRGYYLVWFGNKNALTRGILEFKGSAVTSVTDDPTNGRTVVQIDQAAGGGSSTTAAYVDQQVMIDKLAYVQQVTLAAQWTAVIAENRTGAAISLPGVRLIPYGSVAQDASNYLAISLKVANLDLSSPSVLCSVNTQTGDVLGLNQTLTAGTPVDLKGLPGPITGPFSVPTGKVVLIDVELFGGAPPTCPQFSIIPHM